MFVEKILLLPINLGRVTRQFSNNLEPIIYQGQNIQRCREKTPRETSQIPQASASVVNVKVHDSTI